MTQDVPSVLGVWGCGFPKVAALVWGGMNACRQAVISRILESPRDGRERIVFTDPAGNCWQCAWTAELLEDLCAMIDRYYPPPPPPPQYNQGGEA